VTVYGIFFVDVMPCSLVDKLWRFGGNGSFRFEVCYLLFPDTLSMTCGQFPVRGKEFSTRCRDWLRHVTEIEHRYAKNNSEI